MSYFGNLLGGTLEGVGRGGLAEAEHRDKLDAQRQLQAERAAERLTLQRERAADREAQIRLTSELRGGGGGRGSRSSGGGGGGSDIDALLLNAPPEKHADVIEYVRMRGGDQAANVVARRFGRELPGQVVSPDAGDFARFDRTLDENGKSTVEPPRSYVQRASIDAEAGTRALNRVLAMSAGKFKDYAEGEARTVGTDAVTGAADDTALRRAGAVNMALEGKDRIAVQGNTVVDQAGVTAPRTTEVGQSVIRENNAQAGKASRDSTNGGREVKTKEFQALQQERLSIDTDLKRVTDNINSLRKERPKGWQEELAREQAKLTQLETDKAAVQTRIREFTSAENARGNGGRNPPPPTPKPEATPAPKPAGANPSSTAQSQPRRGDTRTVASGPHAGKTAVFDGKGWKLQ